jgi:hypothetical protein
MVKPTPLAKPNTNYTVKLYQNGQYRASSSVSWAASGIITALTTITTFPCTEEEYQQSGAQSMTSKIFSAEVTQ